MTELQTSMQVAAKSTALWRKTYNSLFVLESLLKEGSPKVVSEAQDGLHFDVVQRLMGSVLYCEFLEFMVSHISWVHKILRGARLRGVQVGQFER